MRAVQEWSGTAVSEGREGHFDEEHLKYSSRPCPRCGAVRLKRVPRPLHLRLLRMVGIDRRKYRCSACRTVSVIRHRGPRR